MEKLIKVEKLNKQNKLISKEVPENLLSLYIGQGWKVIRQEEIIVKPEPKVIVKETKKFENNKD